MGHYVYYIIESAQNEVGLYCLLHHALRNGDTAPC